MRPHPSVGSSVRAYPDEVFLRVLGWLEVEGIDGPISVGGRVPRRVLSALLVRAGAVVPTDVLLDAVWGDRPPASGERTLQSHLTRVREALNAAGGQVSLERRDGGYRIEVDPHEVDVLCFERVVAEAETQPPLQAARTLSAALELWRSDRPFADLDDAPYAAGEVTRLVDLRDCATEHLVAALLDAGDPDSAATQAHTRLLETPYRERLWELLMLARYRQGRQVEALEAYRCAAQALGNGLGLDPGPRLRELQAQVLAQDSRLLLAQDRSRHPCPYKGLAKYDLADNALFVGRERLVDELLARLVDNPMLVVVGPSGAGKSSLVRAGLTGALARGSLPGSEGWTVAVMTPGAQPVNELGRCLKSDPALVVIDQAEEALIANDGAFLQPFGDQVVRAVAAGTRMVLAVRADFYGRLGEHPALARLVGPATVLVAPPDEEELRRIVTEPAARVGLAVDPALVDRVVSQVRGRPGALPILSTALVRTWEHREGDRLSLAAYAAGGGVEWALQRVGEEAWATLATPEQRTACRRILVRLADDEDGSWVRHRASRAEVAPPEDEAANAALGVLIDRRLVVAHQGDIDIAHEALFTEWPRLRGWLEDGRAHADLRARLTRAASSWVASNHDSAELYKGTRLQASLDTVGASPEELTSSEREFLAASVRQSDQELEEHRLRADREAVGRRRSRAVASGLAVALLAAAIAGGFALHQQHKATAAALTSDAGQLGALARTGGNYDLALLYAAQAVKLDPTARTESDLFASLERGEAVTSITRAQGAAESIDFSSDGDSVYAVTTDGVLTRSAAAGGEPASSIDLDAESIRRRLAVLPDGNVVVGVATGVAVVDPDTGRVVQEAKGVDPATWALSPDSHTVALVEPRDAGDGVSARPFSCGASAHRLRLPRGSNSTPGWFPWPLAGRRCACSPRANPWSGWASIAPWRLRRCSCRLPPTRRRWWPRPTVTGWRCRPRTASSRSSTPRTVGCCSGWQPAIATLFPLQSQPMAPSSLLETSTPSWSGDWARVPYPTASWGTTS